MIRAEYANGLTSRIAGLMEMTSCGEKNTPLGLRAEIREALTAVAALTKRKGEVMRCFQVERTWGQHQEADRERESDAF
jgi:hypothetical protein